MNISTTRQTLNSTTLRKQMIAFVDSVENKQGDIAPHPYGDKVDLDAAAAQTKRAAFAIAAAEQGFGIDTELRYDATPQALQKLKGGLSWRKSHFDKKTRELAINKLGPSQRDRNIGVAISSAFALAVGGLTGAMGGAAFSVLDGALIGSLATLTTLVSTTDSSIQAVHDIRTSRLSTEQCVEALGNEVPENVRKAQHKSERYQIANELLPAWVDMNATMPSTAKL